MTTFKPILYIILSSIVFAVGACKKALTSEYKEDAFLEIIDSEALKVIDPTTKIELLGSGYTWTEGPLWIEKGNFLLFSDIPNNKVFKIDSEGNSSVYLSQSGYTSEIARGGEMGSNALLLDNEENLILMQHGDRCVAKMQADLNTPKPQFEKISCDFNDKKLNSPNDGVFDSQGNLYFTDPPYGLEKLEEDLSKEIGYQGVYFVGSSGKAILLDSTISKPNGIILSTDEKKLLVAVSDPKQAMWYQYEVPEPGIVQNKQVFYDATHLIGKEGEQGLPDGMKMRGDGYLFASGPGGIWIFNKQAKPIAKIRTGELTSNCAFSSDEKKLFMTADDYVLAVDLL